MSIFQEEIWFTRDLQTQKRSNVYDKCWNDSFTKAFRVWELKYLLSVVSAFKQIPRLWPWLEYQINRSQVKQLKWYHLQTCLRLWPNKWGHGQFSTDNSLSKRKLHYMELYLIEECHLTCMSKSKPIAFIKSKVTSGYESKSSNPWDLTRSGWMRASVAGPLTTTVWNWNRSISSEKKVWQQFKPDRFNVGIWLNVLTFWLFLPAVTMWLDFLPLFHCFLFMTKPGLGDVKGSRKHGTVRLKRLYSIDP